MLNNIYKFFSYDSLTVYDGDSNGSPMLGKYCGTSIPPNHISSNNNIFIPNKLVAENHDAAIISEFNVKGIHRDANKMSLMDKLMSR